MTELLSRISRILPSYPFEAPQSTPVPYCVYVKNDTPVHTKDGICGYEGTLTISIYAATLSVVNDLASKIVDALDSQDIGERGIITIAPMRRVSPISVYFLRI